MAKKIQHKELRIEAIGFEGRSIARDEDMVYFVKDGIPGDLVNAIVKKKRKSYREAIIEEVLEKSEDRIDPVCKHFESCGGCRWQHLKYDKQLYWKTINVKDSFERLGNVEYEEIFDCLPSVDEYQYRNKMEFTFSSSRWLTSDEIEMEEDIEYKNFALGLHVPGRFDKVVDVEECHIHQKFGNEILNLFRNKALALNTPPYDIVNHVGFLRNLIIRYGKLNNEFMIILVTDDIKNEEDEQFMKWYKEEFVNLYENVSNVVHVFNNSKSPVPNNKPEVFKGSGYITENILGIDYRISPFSFFQTNSGQLDRFIGNILETANLSDQDVVWDLYCGTGSITLPAAKKCARIYGMEIVESSIADAKHNAELNSIENAAFFAVDLHDKNTPELLNTIEKPDKIIIDPPRAGMHKNLLAHIILSGAKEIIYVSCNPATQARDCKLMEDYYKVTSIQPVDMFPHTYHIESIAKLVRKDGK